MKANFLKFLYLALVFCALGCSARSPEALLARHEIPFPVVENLTVCVSYGCRYLETTSLGPAEWEKVRTMMTPDGHDSPEHERWRISKTIGLMENIIGPKVGTQHNRGRNKAGPPGTRQLDCIADMVNTTIYLLLLSGENLLRNHKVSAPAQMGPLDLMFWHHTAVIEEKQTHKMFAVDPWFYDNGHPAAILPLDKWRSGDYPSIP